MRNTVDPILQVAEQLKNTPEIPEKTSKNRFPLYFVWDKKPTKKPKNFRPGPELKTVFIALEMKFAMIFFSARARTENSIYSFGNEVRDDRVEFKKKNGLAKKCRTAEGGAVT